METVNYTDFRANLKHWFDKVINDVSDVIILAGRMYADRSPFNLHNKPFKINFYGNGKISD